LSRRGPGSKTDPLPSPQSSPLHLLVARWRALLLLLIPAAGFFVLAPREPDGSSEGPFVAGALMPALALMVVAIAGRKLASAAAADAAFPHSRAEALLGRPPAPEPAVEFQTGWRPWAWFAVLFGLALGGAAGAATAGVDVPAAAVVAAGIVALLAAFGLPPRRRRIALVLLLAIALVPALGLLSVYLWLLVADFGCAPDAYECPV
jgi:FtsH-binding integral membrane protein